MRAVVLIASRTVEPAELPVPVGRTPEQPSVHMAAGAIDPGDCYSIPFGAPGVRGATGAGTVTAVGAAPLSAAERLGTGAVFDAAGGAFLDALLPSLSVGGTTTRFGKLSREPTPTLSTDVPRLRAITRRGFANNRTDTALDPAQLSAALTDLAGMMAAPEFHTTPAPVFAFMDIARALAAERAVLFPAA
ncbi:MAG: hypothetical protein INR65_18110 [Gluconacetobacter diazotrophicus]|nr:hypothetical protein [Gluconacetobacter diazotrophicus]